MIYHIDATCSCNEAVMLYEGRFVSSHWCVYMYIKLINMTFLRLQGTLGNQFCENPLVTSITFLIGIHGYGIFIIGLFHN